MKAAGWSTDIISIHALREEGDRLGDITVSDKLVFLSTPSARRATCIPVEVRYDH